MFSFSLNYPFESSLCFAHNNNTNNNISPRWLVIWLPGPLLVTSGVSLGWIVSHLLCDEFGDLSFVLQVLRGVYFIACFWCNDLDVILIKSLERSLFQNKLRDTDFWLSNMMYLQSIHWYDVVYYAYIRSFTALYLS